MTLGRRYDVPHVDSTPTVDPVTIAAAQARQDRPVWVTDDPKVAAALAELKAAIGTTAYDELMVQAEVRRILKRADTTK